jgi:colicin import membrane protein
MTSFHSKPGLPASGPMILVSAVVHGLLLTACAVYSLLLFQPPSPSESAPTRVNLVDYSPGPPRVDKIEPEVSAPGPEPFGALQELQSRSESGKAVRETIERKTLRSIAPQAIPLAKSRRRPKEIQDQRVEAEARHVTKPKEDPNAFLQRRIAELRERLGTRRPPDGASATSERTGPQPGSGEVDQELGRWLVAVRSRVNLHWSVFAEDQPVRRVTIIAVKIADDGELIDARVDESSGNQTFDLSAMRAVRQAAPFPSVPRMLREEIRKRGGLALRFTPGGMQ